MNRNQQNQQIQNVPKLELDNLDDLKQRLEIVRHIDATNENLECCCFPNSVTDKRLFVLSAQISVSLLVLIFVFFKLSQDDTDDQANSKIYIPILSSVLGYWYGKGSGSESKK
jgi:Zn-dependent M16 (insulinase) family peptidase